MTITDSRRRQEKNQRDDVMDFARQNYSVQKLSKKQQLLVENWMPIMAKSGIENPCPSRLTAHNQQRWTGQLLNCCEVSEVKERKACAMMPWSNVVLLCITYIYIYIYIIGP